jgi:SAM-dependent methyltransferase
LASSSPALVRLNVGCGPTPTEGWVNYDNSWSVRLARRPALVTVLSRAGLITAEQKHLCDVARREGIRFGTAEAIAHADGSVDVIYSSHMLEHLDRPTAQQFLAEAFRVLKPGGVIRIAVPDLRLLVDRYNADGDADRLVEASFLASDMPRSLVGKLRYLVLGSRHHAWMYDARSLVAALERAGFKSAQTVDAGTTTIEDPGALDLAERADESIYVEARRPAGDLAGHAGVTRADARS